MRTLTTLLKMRRWQLDHQARTVKLLEDMRTEIMEHIEKLDESLTMEAADVQSPEGQAAFPPYLQQVLDRKRILIQSLAEINERVVDARAALDEAYREAKKIERLIADHEEREQIARARRRNQRADELTLARFARARS